MAWEMAGWQLGDATLLASMAAESGCECSLREFAANV